MNLKKTLSLILSAALTLSLAAPALAADLPEGWTPADGARVTGPWYAEAVDYVTEKGMMTGTGNGFEPEAELTRASVLQTLYNMEGRPNESQDANPWYANAALWARENKIDDLQEDSVIVRGDVKTILTAYCGLKGVSAEGLMTGNEHGDLMLDKTLTRAEFAQLLLNMSKVMPVSLADYLSQGGQEWFLTGKTEYTIQGMLVSKDTPYENVLEGNSGVVTDDGVTVLLKGTVDELWPSKLEKVMGTYTKPDGSELTAKDFAKKDTYIDLKTKATPDTNFAMFIPADIQVVVETAWGDVLTANRPGVEHGEGDFLVSTVKDGQPDLSDVWVLNGAVFPNTYDLSRISVTGTVAEVEKYGHAKMDIRKDTMAALGFELGDVLTVTAGSYTGDMPYFDGYYVDSGEYMVRAYPSHDTIGVCINYGKFCEVAGIDVGDTITITLKEKAGALATQTVYSLVYTNDRADYASDEVFANFREVVMGDIAEGKLFRSCTPINNENNRAAITDDLVEKAGVKAVMNLADTAEEIAEYVAGEDFDSPYYKGLYDEGSVIVLGMPVNYASDEFAEGIVKGLTFLSEHKGPYLVHCTEGKDRAGFTAALLEALMGAELDDIVADYMLSYVNYYHIDPKTEQDKYDLIAQGNVMEMLRAVAGLEKGADLTKVDLAKAAETYLTSHGMTAEAVATLKANLKG